MTDANRRQFLLGTGTVAATALTATTLSTPAMSAIPASGFDPKTWWRFPYRIVQTNLREIDVRQDPREIARAVKAFGANALVTNIGGIIAFYPTKLPLQYRNPYLTTDFAGDMIEACRSEGLAVIGRFDLSKSLKKAYDAHPDWFMLNRDGMPREYAGTYQACPNGGWAQSYGREILTEALKRYQPDGLFFNMTGYPQTDYSNVDHGICVCDNCRRRFKAMYGLELPAKEGFTDPNWLPYLQFQKRTGEILLSDTNSFITKFSTAPVLGYDGYTSVGRGEVQRRVDRSPPEWPYQPGEQVRTAMARHPGIPFSATSAAHIDYPWRQVTETADCHLLRFAQQLGVGARLDLYLMGSIRDQDDPSFLTPVSSLFQWHRAHEADYASQVPSARIGLYQSELVARYGGATPVARYDKGAFKGGYATLVDSRLPFWMISDARLADGSTVIIGAYDALLLPHVTMMTDAEAAALDRFVEAGGLLVTTGQTGAYDEAGKARPRNALSCSAALSFGKAMDAHGWSADLSSAEALIGKGRLPLTGHYFPVAAASDASVLMALAPNQRFGPPEFSFAMPGDAPPPHPAILARKHGKGMAIHIPWLIDWHYNRDGMVGHQALVEALIRAHTPAAPFILEGAGAVEMMMMRQTDTGKSLLHLVNYAGQRNGRYDPAPAISGLRLGVRTAAPVPVRSLVRDATLSPSGKAGKPGYVWYDLPPLGAFEALRVG